MALADFASILTFGGPTALTYCALRPKVIDALGRLLFGAVAVLASRRGERSRTSLAVLSMLTGKDIPAVALEKLQGPSEDNTETPESRRPDNASIDSGARSAVVERATGKAAI